jgi:hypothetical protein
MHVVRYIDEKTYQSSEILPKTLLLKLSLQSGKLYLKEQDPIRNAVADTTAARSTSQLRITHAVYIMRIWGSPVLALVGGQDPAPDGEIGDGVREQAIEEQPAAPDHPLEQQPADAVALPLLAVVDALDGVRRDPRRPAPRRERHAGEAVVALWVQALEHVPVHPRVEEELLLDRHGEGSAHQADHVPRVAQEPGVEVVARAPHRAHRLVLILVQVHRDEPAESARDEALEGEGVHGVMLVELRDEAVEAEDVQRRRHVAQELDLVPRLAHHGRPHQVECEQLVLAGGGLLAGELVPLAGRRVLLRLRLAGRPLRYHPLAILVPRSPERPVVDHIGAEDGQQPWRDAQNLLHAHPPRKEPYAWIDQTLRRIAFGTPPEFPTYALLSNHP